MNQIVPFSPSGTALANSIPPIREVRTKLKLPTYHADQARAFWKFHGHRYKLLRCGRRWGKTDMGKVWIADALARGWPCAWYAPQHKVWSEAYSELADVVMPILGPGSSKGGAVMRGISGGRVDFWTLENTIAGRGRHYKRVVVDEGAFTKNGDNRTDGSMMTMFEKVIKPTLFDLGGELLVMSNSAGKVSDNFLYQISPADDGGDPGGAKYHFIEYHAPTHMNPLLPKREAGESIISWLARREAELDSLKTDNDPLVFEQEYRAEFVDWSGVAFFSPDKWLVGDKPVAYPLHCDQVFATIDTAVKTGYEHDGTAVIYWARDMTHPLWKLTILDWDIQKIEGGSLISWLPGVFIQLENFAKQLNARSGSLGAWIEDKGSGTVLLQQARNKGFKAHPIDTALTSMGKDERALNASPHHYLGKIKISDLAFNKVTTYNRRTLNHFTEQVKSFRMADPDADKREDDLLDCYCYGITIALGNREGF